jgi:hypothetical protein
MVVCSCCCGFCGVAEVIGVAIAVAAAVVAMVAAVVAATVDEKGFCCGCA